MSILRGAPVYVDPRIRANFIQHLFNHLERDPDHILLIDGISHREYSRRWILDRIYGYVKALVELKTKEGDVISVCAENSVDMACIVYASLYLGLSISPLNFMYSSNELKHMIALTEPKIIFCSTIVESVVADLANKPTAAAGSAPLVVVIGESRGQATLTTSQLLDQSSYRNIKDIPIRKVNAQENVAGIFSSSGTTGLPKGVSITQSAFHFNSILSKPVLFTVPESEVKTLTFLPWFHIMGFFLLIRLPFMKIQTVFIPRYDSKIYLSLINRYKITSIFVVPPIAVFLAKDKMPGDYDLSSVRELYSGAAPLQEETELTIYRRFPNINMIRQGYGMTEGLCLLLPPTLGQKLKQGSVGLLAKGTDAKVVDPDTGALLGPNQPGELHFRGPQLLKNYHNNPEATRNAFDQDGFLITGDVGYYDEEGYFYIVDRIKDLIKYKGFQVPPTELESLLLTHPKVLDVAVIGIPDERCGELPMAFVVKQPHGSDLTEKQILDFVAKEMSPAKRLHGGVEFVAEIPKNPSGKILRRVLRENYKKGLIHKL